MSEHTDGTAPHFNLEPGKGFNGRPEKIENHDGTIVIENPGMIWHLITLKGAIKLEGQGLRHSSGRSALKHAKDLYGFKGNRAAVLQQMEAKLEELKAAQAEKF